MTSYAISAIGILVFLALAFELYRYVKGHPQALKDLEAKVKGIEASAAPKLESEWARLHDKLDGLRNQLTMVHGAVQAPLQVVVTSTPPPTGASLIPSQVTPSIDTTSGDIARNNGGSSSPVGGGVGDSKPPSAILFDAMAFGGPGGPDSAAYKALQALVGAHPGVRIVGPRGYDLDNTGRELVSAGTVGGVPNSDGPLPSFDQVYAKGRWIIEAGSSVSIPIVAPGPGSYHIAYSGMNGCPAPQDGRGYMLTSPTVRYLDSSGAEVTQQDPAANYTCFVSGAPGQAFTAVVSSPVLTVQDLTFLSGRS